MKETEFIREYKRVRELKNLKIAKERVEIFWETLLDILKEEKKVIFKGWGSFEVKERKAKIFNNPKTKKAERIPACKKIIFKRGKLLKKRFNIIEE
ncbi:HU family DNA-binding protein [Fusobacterium ulcerans]|uniref:HU family DNA-binding protein n=1 Tax=Fusobacterium ulcerans TaxID=861 RepID=UPI002E766578|nr:HU family DNA-binding protein [Fusobacterium ulcerans]MEE0139571.1 HU family DNA-binding protein [Fusobacterium ulcerans]